MPLISVVSPVFRAEGCLHELYRRLSLVLGQMTPDYEIVLVDDGSEDGSWEAVRRIAEGDKRVKGIALSRNFGQHYAITAGLDHCDGDWVVVMDCDLQDRPEEIPRLFAKAQEGYDVVLARRHRRKDSLLVRARSKLFSLVYNWLGGIKIDNAVANFSISSRSVIGYVCQFRERSRAFPLLLSWTGFRRACVDVEHAERFSGRSTYTLPALVRFATDSIIAQSNKPLRLSIVFGFLLSLVSLGVGIGLAFRYLFYRIPVAGWTSIIVSVWFIGGLLFANLGVIGLYLGKVFNETKRRPLYVIGRTCNLYPGSDAVSCKGKEADVD